MFGVVTQQKEKTMLFLRNSFFSNPVKRHRDYLDEILDLSFDGVWDTIVGASSPLDRMGFREYDDGTARLKVDVPGCKMEDIDISVDKNLLTIKTERKDGVHQAKFHTSCILSDRYDPESITAILEDGVMTLSVKRKEKEKQQARKIQIQAGNSTPLLSEKKE